jgi:glycosyltransferase involved in cell wall biosynthesis
MDNIKLTILMPSYNKEQYIKEAIDSVLLQKTDFNFKLVVTDDGSTDRTIEIVKNYIAKYPEKIVLLPSEKNQGLLSNIIKGYKYMDSQYFCVLDADDYYTDYNFYQKAIDFLDKHPDYNIYASNTFYLNDEQEKMPNNYSFKEKECHSTFKDLLNQKAVLGNTISSIFRNNVIDDSLIAKLKEHVGNHYSEHSFREDDFRNRIHLENSKAYYINEIVGFYRTTQSGLYQGSNKLKQVLLKIQSYIDMYYFFNKRYPQFMEMALNQLYRIDREVLKSNINNILNYPIREIIQLTLILKELGSYDEKTFAQVIADFKTKRENKINKNVFRKLFCKY